MTKVEARERIPNEALICYLDGSCFTIHCAVHSNEASGHSQVLYLVLFGDSRFEVLDVLLVATSQQIVHIDHNNEDEFVVGIQLEVDADVYWALLEAKGHEKVMKILILKPGSLT